MPDSPEYLARIKNLSASNFLETQSESPLVLSDLIQGRDLADLTHPPAPGKWSVTEILAHLAEDEIVAHWRYRQILETDGVPLPSFDQDLWASVGEYRSRPPQESLALFRLLREANLRMLGALSPEQWQRSGVHSERGKVTIEDLASHMAGHDLNHIEQIRRILARS